MRHPAIRRALSRASIPLALLLASVISTSCAAGEETQSQSPERAAPEIIPLPPPDFQGALSLEACLSRRRSVREFSDEPLTLEATGQLLWAAQGITDDAGYRTAPSAGALYPLEVYAVRPDGVFHYIPERHALIRRRSGDVRGDLSTAALDQEFIHAAPVVVVITAVYERVEWKYGEVRTPRYVHMEAGHAGQNVLLQAVALGLGAVPVGAFEDGEVQEVLRLPADHLPLYLIPVGHPG